MNEMQSESLFLFREETLYCLGGAEMRKKFKVNYDLLFGIGCFNLMPWAYVIVKVICSIVTGHWDARLALTYIFFTFLPLTILLTIGMSILCAVLGASARKQGALTYPVKRTVIVWGLNLAAMFVFFVVLPIVNGIFG